MYTAQGKEPGKHVVTPDDLVTGPMHEELWQVGTATNLGGLSDFTEIAFEYGEGHDINTLLRAISDSKNDNPSVVFTDKKTFGGYRLRRTYSADYLLHMRRVFHFDPKPDDPEWTFSILVPISQIKIDKIKIPLGLHISYRNRWQELIEFHNNRETDSLAPQPTTHRLYRESLNTGTFGSEEE